MDITSRIQRLRAEDDARDSVPGEHWVVLGIGVALLFLATGRSSALARHLMRTAGTGLVARALSGRDGIQRMFR